MNGKKKSQSVWLLTVLALSFFLGHFWTERICTVEKTIALNVVHVVAFSKVLAGATDIRFLL